MGGAQAPVGEPQSGELLVGLGARRVGAHGLEFGGQPVALGGDGGELGPFVAAPRLQLGGEPVALGLDGALVAAPLQLGGEPVALGLDGALVAAPLELRGQPVALGLDGALVAAPLQLRGEPVALGLDGGHGRALGAQLGDRRAELLELRSQFALGRGPAAAAAPARRRELDDERAADLELGTRDVVARPRERGGPGLLGLLAAGQALAAPAGVDGQRRTRDPPPAHAVPAADHLEAVVGRPLEPLELERNVTDRGHQLSLSASGGSLSSEALGALDGRAGLGRRRAMIDGAHAPAPVTPLDRDREGDLGQAQDRADHHDHGTREGEPRSGAQLRVAEAGRRLEQLVGDQDERCADDPRHEAAIDVVHVRHQEPDGRDERGDRQGGEDHVRDLEHLPGVEDGEPVQEQGDQQYERAQRQHDRPDVESASQRVSSCRVDADKDDKRSRRIASVLNLTGVRFPCFSPSDVGIQSVGAPQVSRPGVHFPLLLPRGRVADTSRPRGVPCLGGHQCGRRLTEVLTQHGRPVTLQPPHERGVVGCHSLHAPERFELGEEELHLAVERGVRRLDARTPGGADDRAVQGGVRRVDRAPRAFAAGGFERSPAPRARAPGAARGGAPGRAAPPRPRAPCAARRAATISSALSRVTRAPRLGSIRTRPSEASSRSAARSVCRATP